MPQLSGSLSCLGPVIVLRGGGTADESLLGLLELTRVRRQLTLVARESVRAGFRLSPLRGSLQILSQSEVGEDKEAL
jgi:hypothetical protein